ncbi:hypothetical protein BTO05_02440 [Winogradskyella sp. PC-19]|jgi:hypothetical protein|nr:hypothetical protein BTO05_02440 [Winogradskyella sp. PC-19]
MVLTLFFLFGFFLFWFIGAGIFIDFFKSGLENVNPNLVKNYPIIFEIFKIFFKLAAVMCLFSIVSYWYNYFAN